MCCCVVVIGCLVYRRGSIDGCIDGCIVCIAGLICCICCVVNLISCISYDGYGCIGDGCISLVGSIGCIVGSTVGGCVGSIVDNIIY